MAAASRRRWSYSLRNMFVLLSLLSIWLSSNRNQVQLRNRLTNCSAKQISGLAVVFENDYRETIRPKMPVIWRVLGAQPVAFIALQPDRFSANDLSYYRSLFPEAEVWLGGIGARP